MKRRPDSPNASPKRQRVDYLIDQFAELYPSLEPPFPPQSDQEMLIIQYKHLLKIPEVQKLFEDNNTPFATLSCKQCKCDKLMHEFPFFANPVTGQRRKKSSIPDICQTCRSININKSKRHVYTDEEKEKLLEDLRVMILHTHRDNSDFDASAMLNKCKDLVRNGVKSSIDFLLENGLDHKIKCNTCKEKYYIYSFRTDVKCRNAIRPKCTKCSLKNKKSS